MAVGEGAGLNRQPGYLILQASPWSKAGETISLPLAGGRASAETPTLSQGSARPIATPCPSLPGSLFPATANLHFKATQCGRSR